MRGYTHLRTFNSPANDCRSLPLTVNQSERRTAIGSGLPLSGRECGRWIYIAIPPRAWGWTFYTVVTHQSSALSILARSVLGGLMPCTRSLFALRSTAVNPFRRYGLLSIRTFSSTMPTSMQDIHSPPSNRLILCFDGTGNMFQGTPQDTNIVKLYNMFDRNKTSQMHYYQRKLYFKCSRGSPLMRCASWYRHLSRRRTGQR